MAFGVLECLVDVRAWTIEDITRMGIHRVAKSIRGFIQNVPGTPGEMVKLRSMLLDGQ